MNNEFFELTREESIDSLNIKVELYKHKKTGARHLHLAADDAHNAFLVAFLTVPEDSTGVAHILEHTALCGSENFPVRDPFFMMLRRSLATFMNAFTSSDWTAYPFASQSRKDFDNLMQVYLDASFFPNLAELDFAQEGFRIEFEDPTDIESDLVYKGIVYNEMKGAMSSPVRVLYEKISANIFPTTTYRFNSGGSPEHIPELTWDELKSFHAKHYHPSNAVFMTFGNIPAADHQSKFEELALKRFGPLDVSDLQVCDEKRFDTPVNVESSYALDGEEDSTNKTHITISWLLGHSFDQETLLKAHMLSAVLMDNSSSPLLKVLEKSKLGTAPSPVCGLDDSGHEMVFSCGLEGSEADRVDAVEKEIFDILQKVASQGVEIERAESVLHQLELSRREIGGDGMPYGLNLMLTSLNAALNGGDPVAALALDPVIEKLREEIKDPNFIKNLVKTLLLDNKHRVRVVLTPDSKLNAKKEELEAQRLAEIKKGLSKEDCQRLVKQSADLKKRQDSEDDPELLPRVTLQDVPADLSIPVGKAIEMEQIPLQFFDQPTNRLVYQQVVVSVPHMEDDLIDLMSIFASCLAEVGSGTRDYLETQAYQSAYTGGVGSRFAIRGLINDFNQFSSYFIVSGKALNRNHEKLATILKETLESARFDELSRLRELVSQMRASAEMRVTDNGHMLAMSAASARVSRVAAIQDRWGGIGAIQRLKTLDDSLNDPAKLSEFANNLAKIRDRLLTAPRQLLLVGEGEKAQQVQEAFKNAIPQSPTGDGTSLTYTPKSEKAQKIGWATVTTVNFCARVHSCVPYTHDDTPALSVLGQFLRNGYLHKAIREKGGAYGGGAGYNADSGTFRFYSYRDPRLNETLADFQESLNWLESEKHEPRTLEEAILGVIGSIDKPGSPAGEARGAFHDNLNGRTPELRRKYRKAVLAVTIADLQRVAKQYLGQENASIAVVSSKTNLDKETDSAWARFTL
ncbi:MAG: insulinase family protein [Magnetococcales bacterium]|nr:insulinase family protein [Magnetococcales bacterium]